MIGFFCITKRLSLVVMTSALLLMPAWAYAKDTLLSTGLGFEYLTGTYGTGVRTDTILTPVTIGVYPTRRLAFTLEIPYVYQSSSAVVSGVFQGTPTGNGTTTSPMSGAVVAASSAKAPTKEPTPPNSSGSTPFPSTTAASVHNSQSGIGDLIARAGYTLVEEGQVMPQVRPILYIKFPTADKDKALGTGEFAEGLLVELSKWVEEWYSFVEVGYIIQNKSSVYPLKNYLSYTGGIGYKLTERLIPVFLFKGETAPVEGSTSFLEAGLKLKYFVTEKIGIDGYAAKGITTNSADYDIGIAAYYSF